MYVCMYVCMYVRIYIYVCTRMCVCMFIYMYVCMYVCMFMYICMYYICVYVYKYVRTYVCMCVCLCMYIYICMYTHVCMYIYVCRYVCMYNMYVNMVTDFMSPARYFSCFLLTYLNTGPLHFHCISLSPLYCTINFCTFVEIKSSVLVTNNLPFQINQHIICVRLFLLFDLP